MNFLELRLGGPGFVFGPHPNVRLPFTFPEPIRSANAALQSFRVGRLDSDVSLESVNVELTTHFDPVQSTTSGEVEIDLQLTGDDGILLHSQALEAEIRMLVIAV